MPPSTRLTGSEPLVGIPGRSVADFWSWAYSDLLTNTIRPLMAEFIVASALGEDHGIRTEWDSVDVHYRGRKIEVKSSGYVQTWAQSRPSRIQFDIQMKQGWDAATNTASPVPLRSADVYVFCLFTEADRQHVYDHIRDMQFWQFYPVATTALNERYTTQKSLALSYVQALAECCSYDGLRARIDSLLDKLDMSQHTRRLPAK